MKVICRTVNAAAVVGAFNVALYLPENSLATWMLGITLGFFAVFPVSRLRKLYLFFADIRPKPRVWPTAALADPQDGYAEEEDWRLLGIVTERR